MNEPKEPITNENEKVSNPNPETAADAEVTSNEAPIETVSSESLDQDQSEYQKQAVVESLEKAPINSTPLIWIKNCLVEQSPEVILRPRKNLQATNRRDFLIYGVGMVGALAAFGWLLPNEVKTRLGIEAKQDPLREKFLSQILNFDDRVGQGLFSKDRLVPTFRKSEMTDVPNNFAGQTPDPSFIPDWKLSLSGTAGGVHKQITSKYLLENFSQHDQITRLVCVEGWSAISWWGGIKFADFIKAFPPKADTKWIQLRSEVNLDGEGNSEPYFVSFDIDSAMHPQTLLATHHNGKPLELEHGAPLRLLAPMKLGLKNIKAITSITYHASEPDDYWNKEGYSYYDGI